MKNKFYQLFLAVTVSLSLLSFSTATEAYQCRWVHAYCANGYCHHGHRVCWQNHSGYRHCGWRNGNRVCWYN